MRICIFLLASLLSPSLSAPTESDRLPQFLQALPFFSELQKLRQSFQDLQANIPAEVMAQITQNLPPFLANLLAAGQQQPAGRGLQDVVQEGIQRRQLQQSLPPFLANLLATQLTNGGSSQLLQQLQTVLPPEVFQQLQQIIANLQQTLQQPAAGRAGKTELTKEQDTKIKDFLQKCYGFGYPYTNYNSYSYYPYNTGYGYPSYTAGYNTGFIPSYTTGYNTGYTGYTGNPFDIAIAGSTGTVPLSNTNGGFVFTGRSALDRGDDKYDDIETMRRWGGKFGGGGKQGWWNKPFYNYQKPSSGNYQKPSYGNYQKPSYGNYQKPTYGNYQNSYSYAYQNYNPYNPTLYPNNNIGIIGENGVVVPPTTTGTTGITTPTTEIVTAIRDHK